MGETLFRLAGIRAYVGLDVLKMDTRCNLNN